MTIARVESFSARLRSRRGVASVAVPLALLLIGGAAAPAQAGDVLAVPLRWCVMDGTPALTNPMGAPPDPGTGNPEPDTDSVLWRRHERASDNIWIPGAEITFRGGITAAIRDNASFPVIPDPCPPTNVTLCQGGSTAGRSCMPDGLGGSPDCDEGVMCALQACPAACTTGCLGDLGDVFDSQPQCQTGAKQGDPCTPDALGQDPARCGADVACSGGDMSEYNLSVSACTAAWDTLTGDNSTNLLGQIAVNIGVWRNIVGGRTGLKGQAQGSSDDGDTCAIPPSDVTMATGGAILAIDNQNFSASDMDFETMNERMVAHELGHTLELGHGDGIDNDEDGAYDQFCDAAENTCATPTTFMSSSSCGDLSTAMTTNQRDTSRALAGVYSGVTIDPPGMLIAGPLVGDQRSDTPRDVMDRSVDMVWVALQESMDTGMTSFSHALFGLIPPDVTTPRQYVVFGDLDGNPATGGAPAMLGFMTAFEGAELVTRVVVRFIGGEAAHFIATPTVWRFMGGMFVECTPASDPLCEDVHARVIPIRTGDDSPDDGNPPRFTSHVVSIEMPNAIRGAIADEVRIQAISERLDNGGDLDRLPDGPLDGARAFIPVAPVFPACLVSPDPVAPGTIAMVEANLLLENQMAKVFLGDRMVAGGQTDAMGNAEIEFRVPIETRPGRRLVTVGNVGTALTADCFVVVLPGPLIIVTPEVAANLIGETHTVKAMLRDDDGAPISGVRATFSVDAGPNAGSTGMCSTPGCASDANGMVSFTYVGDGGAGVDEISVSFVHNAGAPERSNTALKFWDGDCNENDIADTCDVDCGGFGGRCAEVIGCGGSDDGNGDGVPDECNRPPDCSMAGANPSQLWPPNHQLASVSIVGVTDPDGDPIAIGITGISQDEPVNTVGDGNTCPDAAGIGSAAAQVRVERSGAKRVPGDGRVYHLSFTADDGRGGTCSGVVAVCVPHDQGMGGTCVDQGPLFTSTGPCR
jgi:hypothetical protein